MTSPPTTPAPSVSAANSTIAPGGGGQNSTLTVVVDVAALDTSGGAGTLEVTVNDITVSLGAPGSYTPYAATFDFTTGEVTGTVNGNPTTLSSGDGAYLVHAELTQWDAQNATDNKEYTVSDSGIAIDWTE